jgi:Tol biopolymer transport system component
MPCLSNRRRLPAGRCAAHAGRIGLLVLIAVCPGFGSAAEAAEEPTWPMGLWRVAEHGLGWGSPLRRVEIRPGVAPGEAIAIAFTLDDRGDERIWGSAELERPRAAAWGPIQGQWAVGPTVVRLQLRMEPDGRLAALVRRRDGSRGPDDPERIDHLILELDDSRRVSAPAARGPVAARPRPSAPAPFQADGVGLFVIAADGTALRPVAAPRGFRRAAHPSWSPDGLLIAFTAFDLSGRDALIHVVPARGGPSTVVAAGVAPSWSRDGARLAYMASGQSALATDWSRPGRNDERIEAVRLTGPGAGAVEVLGRGLWPRWSPADDRLAFVGRRESNWDVCVRSADGMALVRLTDDPALDTYPLWTPDGLSLIFLSDRGNRWDLFQVPADGRGAVSRLTNQRRREERPTLSPDGTRIAYTEELGGSDSRILVLDLAAETVRVLIDPPNGDRDPSWSPDGRSIAFVSRRPAAR